MAIMGLARGGRVSGEVLFEGRDLLKMHGAELREIRGKKIAMIFQDPLSSLHPYYKVGSQIAEMILAHEKVSKKDARNRAIDLLRLVGISRPERRVDDYPHQFSGGMRQRAMIAMALALDPAVLIADEPTTALDVTVQAQVLDLIERLQQEFGTAIVVITHDLGVVADVADDVLVMYAGKPVEVAERRTVYYGPHMPYTWGLLQSLPSTGAEHTGERLLPIKGLPPSLINLPKGCSFNPRCPYVMEVCTREEPKLLPADPARPEHLSACHLSLEDKERIWQQEVVPTR
ncbi:MAG TPA: ABC transporter ATP-binding protein, partial [Actinomycetota bacterium]|nr:ABC transporter ATP-binding protein [Actinomycetota bacterium]